MRELVAVLGARCSGTGALRPARVGHRMARERLPVDGGIEDRLALATDVLAKLGGLAEIEPTETGYAIRGCSCPLAALVESNPDGCVLAEAMLSDLVGLPVRGSATRAARAVPLRDHPVASFGRCPRTLTSGSVT